MISSLAPAISQPVTGSRVIEGSFCLFFGNCRFWSESSNPRPVTLGAAWAAPAPNASVMHAARNNRFIVSPFAAKAGSLRRTAVREQVVPGAQRDARPTKRRAGRPLELVDRAPASVLDELNPPVLQEPA